MPLTRSQQTPPFSPSADASTPTTSQGREEDTLDTDVQTSNHDASPGKPAQPRIPDPAVPYFKLARKALQGSVRAEHHAAYLGLCLTNNTSPRGLQSRIPPAVPDQDFEFMIQWENAHHDFSRTLTDLLHNYYIARTSRLQTELSTCNVKITELCTVEVQTHIQSLLDKIQIELKQELEARRTRKINRDVEGSRNTN